MTLARNLSALEVSTLLAEKKIILVDVREPAEYASARIQGAMLFPLSTFDPAFLPTPNDARPLVFQCGTGKRSGMAMGACEAAGIDHAHHLEGGIGAWQAAGLPTLSIDPSSGHVQGGQ